MAVVEENWQPKRSTIMERTTFVFNNQLLSDVKFVVPVSIDDSDRKKSQRTSLCLQSAVLCSMPCFMVKWRRLQTLLNCLTVITRAC